MEQGDVYWYTFRAPDKQLIGGLKTYMVQKLNNSERMTRDTVADQPRNELMNECLRKAEEIRRGLEGRQHSDSTNLIAEDRKR